MNRLLLAIICCLITISGISQSDPRIWFDTQYVDAIEQCRFKRKIIFQSLHRSQIPVEEAMSVVFPEMLRYSLWRDIFETKALELLYVNQGASAADFSIGWFQMKPSFAEKIEREIALNDSLAKELDFLIYYKACINDTLAIRRERIARLKLFQWQLFYLDAFLTLIKSKFDFENTDKIKRLSMMAAAYNRGWKIGIDTSSFHAKNFPYGRGGKNPFSYAEVAVYFYKNDANKIFKLNPN